MQKGEAMKKGFPDYERRPFRDLKELVTSAAELMPDKTYLRYKGKEKGEVIDVSYKQFNEYIENLGTAFYSLGLKGKHIAVIGKNGQVKVHIAEHGVCPSLVNIANGGGHNAKLQHRL